MSLDYEQEVLTEKLQIRISEVGCKYSQRFHWLRDTILILKNQQATSTTTILWKSEHSRIALLNKFV